MSLQRTRRDNPETKHVWQIVLLDRYGRSIDRTAIFHATVTSARARTPRVIAREMRSDALVHGGYLKKATS